jgi:hypothetical protein
VVREPTISKRSVDYYYAICSYVWCDLNFVYTIFVCMATFSSEVTSHLKSKLVPGISCPMQVVPLITFYPIMFFIITYQCIGLILMDPIGHRRLIILFPCLPLNHFGSFAIALYSFGFNITLSSCSNYSVILFIVHVKIIIFNWNIELN